MNKLIKVEARGDKKRSKPKPNKLMIRILDYYNYISIV